MYINTWDHIHCVCSMKMPSITASTSAQFLLFSFYFVPVLPAWFCLGILLLIFCLPPFFLSKVVIVLELLPVVSLPIWSTHTQVSYNNKWCLRCCDALWSGWSSVVFVVTILVPFIFHQSSLIYLSLSLESPSRLNTLLNVSPTSLFNSLRNSLSLRQSIRTWMTVFLSTTRTVIIVAESAGLSICKQPIVTSPYAVVLTDTPGFLGKDPYSPLV